MACEKFPEQNKICSSSSDNVLVAVPRSASVDSFPCISKIQWRRGAVVITTAQLHSTKRELRLCLVSNPARGVSETRNGEDL